VNIHWQTESHLKLLTGDVRRHFGGIVCGVLKSSTAIANLEILNAGAANIPSVVGRDGEFVVCGARVRLQPWQKIKSRD
jgi:hypothetical protein